MTNLKEKYIATLVGCAVGDSLGMPVESWKREQIQKYVGRITDLIYPVLLKDSKGEFIRKDEFGRLRYLTRDLKRGEYTDDTILTLALAESIAEKKSLDLKDIAKKQLEAYELCIQPDGHVKGGFGTTTRLAFNNLRTGKSPLESGIIGGPGNAPAMKMSPLGLYMDATNSYEKGIQFSNLISRITHLDHRSIASGAVQSHCIYTLLRNPTKENFLDSLEKVSQTNETLDKSTQEIKLPSLTSKLEWINNNRDASEKQAFQELGNSGRVYESYPFALFMFQKYWENPLQGLIETVNYGGDCDTTGAIYGALCGSKNGMIFPKNLLNIQNLDKITKAAVRIYELKK